MAGKVADELVPMVEGAVQNQPCMYGWLVVNHSVYCDHPKGPRKCRRSWYYGRAVSVLDKDADEDCSLFEPNPAFSEDKGKLDRDIVIVREQRGEFKRKFDELTEEGWLCHRCRDNFSFRELKSMCYSGTLVTGLVTFREDCNYSGEDISKHFELDPMEVDFRKECKFFVEEGKSEYEAEKVS